ncbi:hypothetical protein O6H91_Y423200 [Diphasiastrum complanatum]|nr:hypothetical protein O6H91_Y423200 [Diphasiastrum complanatum]
MRMRMRMMMMGHESVLSSKNWGTAAAVAADQQLTLSSCSSSSSWVIAAQDRVLIIPHTRKIRRIRNGFYGNNLEKSKTRKNELFGRNGSRLCVLRDDGSCLSAVMRGRCRSEGLKSGGELGSIGLEQQGGWLCKGNAKRASGVTRAIPENTFWLTAAQAMSVPLLLVAVTVISSLAIEKRLENEAIEQASPLFTS